MHAEFGGVEDGGKVGVEDGERGFEGWESWVWGVS